MSLVASFCAVLSLRDVLGEIWDLIESVSEGFLTYNSCLLLGSFDVQMVVFF